MVADHAPMVLSFLHKTFIQPNVRSMSQPALASKLADHLYVLRELACEEAFPKRADQYLDDWPPTKKAGSANTIRPETTRRTSTSRPPPSA
jgi:hypothetical protein